MSLPGAWPAAPDGMPASITSGPGTSSWSPGCPGWPARYATSPASPPLLAERGIDLVVLKQGNDTATVAGQFTFHVLAAMDEMLADLIGEGTKEGLASGRVGGRKPRLSTRQAEVARGMYAETGSDGKRRYTVDEIAGTFAVSRKTIYRHLDKNHAQRQSDKSTRPRPVTGPETLAPPPLRSRQRQQARQWRGPARSASVPASPLPRWPALPADTSPPAGPKRSGNARISRSSGSTKTAHPGRSASTGTARAANPTSNAAPLNARTAATALSAPAPSSISSASTIRTSPRRSAPGSPATDGNSNPNRYVPPTAIASRTDSGSCTYPRHRPACSAPEAGPGFREDELAGGGQVWPCSTCSLLLWMRAT